MVIGRKGKARGKGVATGGACVSPDVVSDAVYGPLLMVRWDDVYRKRHNANSMNQMNGCKGYRGTNG